MSPARSIHESHRLANGPTDYEENTDGVVYAYGFGSYHSGICHFAMGDGAVRSVSNTVSMQILCWLTDPADGNNVSLP